MIRGNKVELVPATIEDKQRAYEWCCHSETTKSHSGPPDYPESPISTWEEFFDEGYVDYFFDGSQLQKGRAFIVQIGEESVGFVSYTSFHLKPNRAELDIWMNREAHCGKGYGSDALVALAEHLNQDLGVRELIIRPSVRNTRAISAYLKAGFEKTDATISDFVLEEYLSLYGVGDYGEGGDLLLVKKYTGMKADHT